MQFLFGIVGFILGAGLLYWLQRRQLAKTQYRLERVEKSREQVQKALDQTEMLNKQQAAQLQKFEGTKVQTADLEHYYQAKLQEVEQSYQAKLQEVEQSYQAKLQETQSQTGDIEQYYPAKLQEVEQSYQTKLQEVEQSYQAKLQETQSQTADIEQSYQAKLQEVKAQTVELEQSYQAKIQELQEQLKQLERPQESPKQPIDIFGDQSWQTLEGEEDSDIDIFPFSDILDDLSLDTEKVAHLPETPNIHSNHENSLNDLFSDQENSSNELEELLNFDEVKGDSTLGTSDK